MRFFTVRLRLILLLFVLPLLLLAYSGVQQVRVALSFEKLHEMQRLQTQLLSPRPGTVHVPSWLYQGSWDAQAYLDFLHQRLPPALADEKPLAARGTLSWIGLTAGLATLLVAGGLMGLMLYASRRSRHSKQYMLQHLASCWRRVALLCQLHTALVVITLASMVCYEVLWSYSHWYRYGVVAILFTLPLWAMLGGGLRLLWRMRRDLTALPVDNLSILGQVQGREKAPGLWQWVEQVATRAGAPLPDNIIIGIDDSFFVTAAPVTVLPDQLLLRGHTLYLPLPYLTALSQPETEAIIGHELGHFTRKDTEYGTQLSVIRQQIEHQIEHLADHQQASPSMMNKPPLWVAVYFLLQFETAFHHWSRQQELAADRIGASVAGSKAFASALLRLAMLSEPIELLLASSPTPNMVQALAEQLAIQPLQFDQGLPGQGVAHPFDAHPSTSERLAALSIVLDEHLIAQATRPIGQHDAGWFAALLAGREVSAPPAAADDDADGSQNASWQLAHTLSALINQQQQARQDEVRLELHQIVDEVPEKTTFTTSRKFLYATPLLAIVCWLLAALFFSPGRQNEATVGWCLLMAGLLFCLIAWQHRHAGKAPFVSLTRREIWIDNFSAPVDLSRVTDLSFAGGMMTFMTLHLQPGTLLPRVSKRWQVFASHGVVKRGKKPHISFVCPGLLRDGKRVEDSELIFIFHNYLNAASAGEHLRHLSPSTDEHLPYEADD